MNTSINTSATGNGLFPYLQHAGMNEGSTGASPVPTGKDAFCGSVVEDPALAQARKLSTFAPSAANSNPIGEIPTSMFPVGQSAFHATAKYLFFSEDLGDAQVNRTSNEISVKTQNGDISISADGQKPGQIDVALFDGQKYEGHIEPKAGGNFSAVTTDGKRLDFSSKNNQVDVDVHGFPGAPDGTKVTLTRLS